MKKPKKKGKKKKKKKKKGKKKKVLPASLFRMHKRRPLINAGFILDYELAEQALNVQWVNGKPIFRQPFQLVGGNGSSTAATDLNTVMETLIDATWAGFVIGSGWFANAGTTTNGIVVDLATGLLTVRHTGENLTGELVFCVLEYTKI